jgi:hypothetical protein
MVGSTQLGQVNIARQTTYRKVAGIDMKCPACGEMFDSCFGYCSHWAGKYIVYYWANGTMEVCRGGVNCMPVFQRSIKLDEERIDKLILLI